MGNVFVKKIQIEFYDDGGLRGATVTYSDKTISQITTKSPEFEGILLARLRSTALAADLLRLHGK